MKYLSRSLLVGLSLILASTTASAIPLLNYSGSDVVGVTGLEVGGIAYDVSWQEGSYNAVFDTPGITPTFLGSSSGAQDAANALLGLFNSESLLPSGIGGLCTNDSFDCDFVIPWAVNATRIDAFNVDWSQPGGPWVLQPQNWSRDFDNDLVAMALFTRAVPEPATLALLALGLVGIGAARRRKN